MAVHKNITQKKHYCSIDMYASYGSSTVAHVSSNARAGTGRCSSNFLFNVCIWGFCYTCIQKCTHSQIVCNCFWRFTFCL